MFKVIAKETIEEICRDNLMPAVLVGVLTKLYLESITKLLEDIKKLKPNSAPIEYECFGISPFADNWSTHPQFVLREKPMPGYKRFPKSYKLDSYSDYLKAVEEIKQQFGYDSLVAAQETKLIEWENSLVDRLSSLRRPRLPVEQPKKLSEILRAVKLPGEDE